MIFKKQLLKGRVKMDYKDLANLIFPDAKPISYYEEKYPERNLPEGAMVVRFAPSPTGYVHIGGLYQSIICTTLAKQTKGVSILRIEDTDQKREIENGTAPRIPQSDDFTLAPMLDKEMSKIDWQNKSALEIKNLVRGLNPIMGTYSFLDGKKFKFWKVEILLSQPEYESQDNGTIIKSDSKDGLYIKAKDGIIKVLEIQAENAKKMNIGDFLRGNTIEVGKKFE